MPRPVNILRDAADASVAVTAAERARQRGAAGRGVIVTLAVVAAAIVLILVIRAAMRPGEQPAVVPPATVQADADRQPGWVDEERLANAAEAEPGSWLAHGQDYDELRFSTLTQINRDSVSGLGVAWYKDLGNRRRMQSTPLVIDGVMYVTDPWSIVYALDAASGEEIWSFDPQTDKRSMRYACCGSAVNRGVAAYKGRIYFATFDARLLALDQATGEVV